MKFFYTFFLLVFIPVLGYSQGEANIWYFGRNAGVDFNGGAPVGLTNGALNTGEGCASISDANGNLLFYTDGIFVYNRTHQQMPNGFGMFGDPSAAQSAIIVPQPGSNTRFIIFTVDGNGGPNGFAYSEVDMTLDNGMGDVIAGTKNTVLFTPSVEKLTAVKHANGLYVWVLGHGLNNNRYYAYLVDCDGVNAPVTTDVGSVEGVPGWGCLAASPNGLRLGSAMRAVGFEVYDFNPSTGVVSNPINLGNAGSCYGVSFSPNNNLLYGLSIQGSLLQWNLQAGTPANIIASVQNLGVAPGTGAPYNGGAIQQGPDGKLYIPDFNRPYLTAINNPNIIGPGCNIQANAVDLQGRSAVLGLPPFIQSFFDTTLAINYSGTCQGIETDFLIGGNTTFFDSVYWHFDDPSSGSLNTSTLLAPSHEFTSSGIYNVQLIKYLKCIADTSTEQVEITAPPIFNQNAAICDNGSYTLPDGNVVSAAGVYNDTLSDPNGCDSVVVTTLAVNPTYLSAVYDSICQGETYMLPDGNSVNSTGVYNVNFNSVNNCDSIISTNLTVLQNTSSILNPEICDNESYSLPGGIIVDSAGTYQDTLMNASGCDSLITVNLTVYPTYIDSVDISICDNESYNLPDGNTVSNQGIYNSTLTSINGCDSIIRTNLTVLQNTSSILNPEICDNETYIMPGGLIVDSTDTYLDTLVNANGCDSLITVNLTVNPTYIDSVDAQICDNESYTLPDGNTVNIQGVYNSLLSSINGCDSLIVTTLSVFPTYQLDVFDTICSGTTYILPDGRNVSVAGNYTNNLSSINACDSLVNLILTVLDPEVNIVVEDVTCNAAADGEATATASSGLDPYSYSWNNQETTTTINNLAPGIYRVTLTDAFGCIDSSSAEITQPDSLEFTTDILDVSCYENEDGQFFVNPMGGTDPYTISIDGVTQSSNQIDGLALGTYSLVVTDANNCSSSSSIQILRPDSVFYSYEPANTELELGDSIQLFVTSNYDPLANYSWVSNNVSCNDCNDPNVFFYDSDSLRGQIEIASQNQLGVNCYRDISIFIEVDARRNLFFPNAFSPNGDSNNDYYHLTGNFKSVRTFSFQIFDRWGKKVFESDEPDFEWNGKLPNGQNSYTGVYTFNAVYSFLGSNQKIQKNKGSITLLR